MAQARRVANILDIPFYVVDAKDVFRNTVVEYFLEGYASGSTPNPCLICNRKFAGSFCLTMHWRWARSFMATGIMYEGEG